MTFIIWLLTTILVLGILIYRSVTLIQSSLSMVAMFWIGHMIGTVGPFLFVLLALVLVPLNLPIIRKSLLSSRILTAFKTIMPPMSNTEKEAISAGTVWWEAELFKGTPNWEKLHGFNAPRLSEEEQAFLDGPVEEACKMCNDWEITHSYADMPPELWNFLKEKKFFAMIIKKEYGGLEFSSFAQSRVLQKLAGVSTVLASTVGVPNSLGPGELLQLYGTKEQKDHYLPRLADGREIPCFALTSPEAGSDAGAIPDTGEVCHGKWEGRDVLGIKLNFNKRYITLAPVATVIGLAFKLYDPKELLGKNHELGITAALIPSTLPGLDIGRRHLPLNVPFMNGPIRGKDLFVPLEFIIGGESMAGKGWQMLVECLSVGRAITLPSNSAGGIKSLALVSGAYARVRRQFNIPVGKMEGVEEALARLGGNAYLMDAVNMLSTTGIDSGEKPSVISAIAKYHMTEKLRLCMNDAMDIHGGKGICLGPTNYLGRGYQGVPVAITVEGANILTRNMIIYGQGAIRCHPFVLAEMDAAAKPDMEGLDEFDAALFGHLGFVLKNIVRTLYFGLGGYKLSRSPVNDSTGVYYQLMNRFSANLALYSDVAMAVHGGALKRKERISARLGDMLSYLYIGSAILKRFEDEGRLDQDLPLVHWAMQDTLVRLQDSHLELLNNFGIIGKILSWAMYPFGKVVNRPSDILDHKIAEILTTQNEVRSRLGNGQFLDPTGLHGKVEETMKMMIAAEPLVDKISEAAKEKFPFTQLDQLAEKGLSLKVITQEEADHLVLTEQFRLQVINVDDFDQIELMAGQAAVDYKGITKPKKPVKSAVKKQATSTAKKTTSTEAKNPTKRKITNKT